MAVRTLLQSSGIYLIRNIKNGRMYVGAAGAFGGRWRLHKRLLKAGKHHSVPLQRSWDKHGEEHFSFEVVEIINSEDFADIASFRGALKIREQHWMDVYRSASRDHGFNLCPAAFSPLGIKHSEETKAKHRASWTPERRKAQSEDRRLQKLSSEHKEAFCFSTKGKIKTAEHRSKLSAAHKGKQLSPEARAKVALANKGRKHTAETRTKMSLSGKARIAAQSAEQRQNRLAALNRPESIAKRARKISIALRRRFAKSLQDIRQSTLPLEL